MNTLGMAKRAHKNLKMLAKGKLSKSPNQYVWCYVDGDKLTPLGIGKNLRYALSLAEAKVPKTFRLYELVPVKEKS